MKKTIQNIIKYVGDDPEREGLKNCEKNFKETLDTFFSGYRVNTDEIFNTTSMPSYDSVIFIKNIDLISICEDHFLPFIGLVSIAYVPNNKITGIGDFTNLVNAFCRRLQLQERLTMQIGQAIDKYLEPKGVAIRIAANHLCVKVNKYSNKSDQLITSYFSGIFKTDQHKINEFWQNI